MTVGRICIWIAIPVIVCGIWLFAWGRDAAPVRAFRKANPCPVTGQVGGACPGWVVDHKIPLCAGGPDAPENMQWQTREESLKKDRWEREICSNLRRY